MFRAKGRPPDNPLIVHVADLEGARDVAVLTGAGRRLLEAFAPGPLTVVLPARPGLLSAITAGLETVAVRVPAGPALEVVRRLGAPVVAPSANRSGRPSPTTWQAVLEDLDGRIDAILQGPPTPIGLESTVVDASAGPPVVLRPGSVTLDQVRAVCPRRPQRQPRGRHPQIARDAAPALRPARRRPRRRPRGRPARPR